MANASHHEHGLAMPEASEVGHLWVTIQTLLRLRLLLVELAAVVQNELQVLLELRLRQVKHQLRYFLSNVVRQLQLVQ